MIARRIAALAATVALIAAAILVRDRLIESDDGPAGPSTAPTELICATEFSDICRDIDVAGLAITVEEAGRTLDRLGSNDPNPAGVLWLTLDPFPEMVDVLRARPGVSSSTLTTTPLATAPIALVSDFDTGFGLSEQCGDPVDWRCLGDSALTSGFSRSTDSGTGLLGVTQAALGYSGTGDLMLSDAQFQRWLRGVVTQVPESQLSGGTAVATIQTRPSSMDVAVGAEAELGETQRTGFVVQYAEPMIRADVALAVSADSSVPGGLVDALSTELRRAGWTAPVSTPNPLPDPATVNAIRTLWKDLA